MKTLKQIKVGNQFKFKDFTYTKLNEDGLVLLDELKDNWHQECIFDNVNNDYVSSLIRYYINSPKHMGFLGLKDEDFAEDKFGYLSDRLFLLSVEEIDKYRGLIKPIGISSWLRSGYYKYSHTACSLYPSGADYGIISVNYSRAVRPALYLNLNSEVEEVSK